VNSPKRVVFICFYDRTSLSLRALLPTLKNAGHDVHLIFMKGDRASSIERLREDAVQYQMLWLDKFWGCGLDVNPITANEWCILKKLIVEISPHVIAISSRSVHMDLAKKTVKALREVAPNAIYLAGGYGPTLEPLGYLKEFGYVCIGEGDSIILPFVEAEDPSSIPNIGYIKNGEFVLNEILKSTKLDELPYPDWEQENNYMVEDDKLHANGGFYDQQTYQTACSRGCSQACSYCMTGQWDRMMGKYGAHFPKIRLRKPTSVINELKIAKEKYDIKFVDFRDAIFGLNEKWVFEFMDLFDKHIGVSFNCLLDERVTTENVIKRLARSGVTKTTVGIQSAHEDLRKVCFNRPISDRDSINYAKVLERNGIGIKYDIIGWNPFETEKTLKDGLKFIRKLPKSHETVVYQMKIFPGSRLLDTYKQEKPAALPMDVYSFWALIYEMVLFSKESEEEALKLVEKDEVNFDMALDIYKNTMTKIFSNKKLYVLTDIKKGRKITGNQLGLIETNEEGVTGLDRYKITSLATKNFIKKNSIIKWDDLDYSYQQLSAR